MLEVAFSESVAGSLKYAIGMKRGQLIQSGAAAVFCEDPEEKERILKQLREPKVWRGGEISGSARDVVSLHLQLDWGDLSALQTDPEARRAPLEQLFGHYEGVTDDLIGSAKQALSRVLEADEMRLWIGEADACDLTAAFWICHLLRRKDVKIYAVYVPMLKQDGDEILRYSGAADLEPEALSLYAETAVRLSPQMRRYMANRWCELREENAPLRAMINGTVTGAPEDLYDLVLKREIPEGECVLGRIIGGALGNLRAVGDALLYRRICAWIDEGILELVRPARDGNPYSAVVQRGTKW